MVACMHARIPACMPIESSKSIPPLFPAGLGFLHRGRFQLQAVFPNQTVLLPRIQVVFLIAQCSLNMNHPQQDSYTLFAEVIPAKEDCAAKITDLVIRKFWIVGVYSAKSFPHACRCSLG